MYLPYSVARYHLVYMVMKYSDADGVVEYLFLFYAAHGSFGHVPGSTHLTPVLFYSSLIYYIFVEINPSIHSIHT